MGRQRPQLRGRHPEKAGGTIGANGRRPASEVRTLARESDELTIASVWKATTGRGLEDSLLEWPPDALALAHVILLRSEAHRFALSPPGGTSWPPSPAWAGEVSAEALRYADWVEDTDQEIPDRLWEAWDTLWAAAERPLDALTDGRDWRTCEALLTLHAIADEACAGLAVALTTCGREGLLYRARGRELLARTGSLSRIPTRILRVLPVVRASPRGTTIRALSRYAGVHRPGVAVRWYKVPAPPRGAVPRAQHLSFLLLPWPLRVRESDFHPIAGSVRGREMDPHGFFEFAPPERLDIDLAGRLLEAALQESGSVDVVCLPESAVAEDELAELEDLLSSYGVPYLLAGVRGAPEAPGEFGGNWVHLGAWTGERWLAARQNKHHRWSLDGDQIHQYHLGGALHPRVRWWDAMEVPRRCIHFVEGPEGINLATLACEDLAQIDPLAEILRSVGPTVVYTPLLDGPQLSSRWAARYAGVLADDPGSAVLTLTSAGMTHRCRPNGRQASPVVALWRDAVWGTQEIPLEPGAQAVLLTVNSDLTIRRSGDGREPVENCTEFFHPSLYQVRDGGERTRSPVPRTRATADAGLTQDDLTILVSWCEAVAEALECAPDRLEEIFAESGPTVRWRAELGIAEPSRHLCEALEFMIAIVRGAGAPDGPPTTARLLTVLDEGEPDERPLARCARRALRSALEQRQTSGTKQGPPRPALTAAVG
jgi:hypothetical protein